MFFLHDIWINWIEGAIKGYQVPEFFEWHASDDVTLMDVIPLIKVEEGFFDYVEDGINELPSDLMQLVKNSACMYKKNEKVNTSAFVITDGRRILAVDPVDSNTPSKKSRLTLRHERRILEMLEGVEPLKFEYTPLPEGDFDFFNAPEQFMYGLTRTEREMKSLIFEGLILMHPDENIAKLRYLYHEWDYNSIDSINDLEFKDLMVRLLSEVSIGFHQGHKDLAKAIANTDEIINSKYKYIIERKNMIG